MTGPLDSFREGWRTVRGLTYDFVSAVPDARWSTSPGSGFASFSKQVRHLVCVQGVYHEAFARRPVDFARKHDHYAGGLDRESLTAALRVKDAELFRLLDELGEHGAERLAVPFFGKTMSFTRFAAVMIQHEAIHHGQWSFYAALGGFPTPSSWRLNWGL